MRRINSRGLVAAMESEEEVAAAAVPEVETPAVVIGDNAESLETDLIDITEDVAETAEADAQVDEALEVVEALESISEGLRAAAGAGGLSREGAHVVGMAIDHMYGRVGIRTAVAMPALESFGGTSTRVQATTIAYEEIKEEAKKLWVKIVAAIEKSIQWLKEKFELIFGGAGKLKARADALATKAASLSGDAKSGELDNGRLVAALHVGGKVDGVVAAAGLIKASVEGIFGSAPARTAALAAYVDSGDEAKISSFLDTIGGGELADVSSPDQDGFKVKEGFSVKRSKELPGGKAVVAMIPKEAKGAADSLASSSYGIGAFKPNAKAPADVKLKTLAPTEVEKLAKEVSEFADALQKAKINLTKANDDKKNLVAAIKKHGSDAKTEEEQKSAKAARAALSAISKLIDQPIYGASAYLLNTGKSLMDYAEESLKQYAK